MPQADLNAVLVFVQVVASGGFAGAARELGLPKSTVSRKVAELEQSLGARLLQRTTRKINLTEAGRVYYDHASKLSGQLEAASLALQRLQHEPAGLLRVTAPLNFEFLGEAVAAFLVRYPKLGLELEQTDRVVDLVEERFDLAIRAGKLRDSTLIARRLGALESVVVASPEFVERHGAPKTPQAIREFDAVVFSGGGAAPRWQLERKGDAREADKRGPRADKASARVVVEPRPRLFTNDFDVLSRAAQAGVGIALLPVQRAAPSLQTGHLVRLLHGWGSTPVPVHAVYPSNRHLAPAVAAFVEHLVRVTSAAVWPSLA